MARKFLDCFCILLVFCAAGADASVLPTRVTIPIHGESGLPAYFFDPRTWYPHAEGPFPVVIMLHGRSGSYRWDDGLRGEMTAKNLSARHHAWGLYWSRRGFIALHVDSFTSRGYAGGFEKGSYLERPPEVSEVSVRPRDALAAYEWLIQQPDVDPNQIGLQGWSNGASAALATVLLPPHAEEAAAKFRFAIAFYPGCRRILEALPLDGMAPHSTPLLLLCAGQDQEVKPMNCVQLFDQLGPGPREMAYYSQANHSFDSPNLSTQRIPANAKATQDALETVWDFVQSSLNRH